MSATPNPAETPVVWLAASEPSDDGEIAFYVRDGSLGTIHSCVARWVGLGKYEGIDQPVFNLRTGYPESDVFSTSEGCAYLNEPSAKLTADPDATQPVAFVNGDDDVVEIFADPLDVAESEEIELWSGRIDAGSVFEVRYYFHVVDTYYRRVRAKSPSDDEGEPLAIREVASESDSSRSATSGLFRGHVYPGTEMNRRNITIEYTDRNGNVISDSKTPTPTPFPTPILTPLPSPTSTPAAKPRNLSVKFANRPARSGDKAVFYISDNYLGSTLDCTVKWEDIPHDVDEADPNDNDLFMPWNVFTGDPVPSAFSREGCEYDGTTPLAEPLSATLKYNGDDNGISPAFPAPDTVPPPPNGLVSIRTKAPKGSTVKITFHYQVVDAFPAHARRARVYSSSDRQGEWVAIREVTSRYDPSPAAATSLYRGEIAITNDETIKDTIGDGKVFVRERSWLSVAYYDAYGSAEPIRKASVKLDLPTPTPTPTPTPIPASNPMLLAIAVIAGVFAVLARRRRVMPSGG